MKTIGFILAMTFLAWSFSAVWEGADEDNIITNAPRIIPDAVNILPDFPVKPGPEKTGTGKDLLINEDLTRKLIPEYPKEAGFDEFLCTDFSLIPEVPREAPFSEAL